MPFDGKFQGQHRGQNKFVAGLVLISKMSPLKAPYQVKILIFRFEKFSKSLAILKVGQNKGFVAKW